MATKKHTLKLFVDTRSNKVLFAEAGNEMADFFFGLLALPVGSVVKLLSKECIIGSLGELYGSLESLSATYIQPGQKKATFLNPPVSASSAKSSTLLIEDRSSSCEPKCLFNRVSSGSTCSRLYYTDVYGTQGPSCRGMMTYELKNIGNSSNVVMDGSGGLVKEGVTYMVMDDLAIMPLSTISIITLLNKFNVKEVSSLQETVVELGMDEVRFSGYRIFSA
ncbi:hypothetical protein QJS04_geneDACA024451 [Acorus gramineus]|uniref:DUF674 domain-containing protein n=1 Tax=Acorus gramineus TaxID=55184 RepID=A0AAV8ZXC3_ACOGR|nr:hypothetical protein QJS04_geneDACA024451 [Acorus gramineus]